MRRLLYLLLPLLSLPARAAGPCAPPEGADARPAFDASLLKEGRFTYRTTLEGELIGETVLEVRRQGATWRIDMSAPKIEQSWHSTFEQSFAPLTAHLEMKTRSGPYEMSLRYEAGKVTGEERRAGAANRASSDQASSDQASDNRMSANRVSAEINGTVIDQRVDWASVMSLPAITNSAVSLSVYDPSTGSSPMLGQVGAVQELEGAFGAATALRLGYRICKRERVEEYTVYATQATPRYMLREDMPNGLVSELIRVEP